MKASRLLFDTVKCRNKCYCIESSSNMLSILPSIKSHIIASIKRDLQSGYSSNFNILCFNSDTAKWCVSMVPYTTDFCAVAEEWLRHIQAYGTCNFIAALASALQDPLTTDLFFVVCQRPDQTLEEILNFLNNFNFRPAIHIRFYLNEESDELLGANEIYSAIIWETRGTMAYFTVDSNNEVSLINNEDELISGFEHDINSESLAPQSVTVDYNKQNLVELLPGCHKDIETGEIYPFFIHPFPSGKSTPYSPFDMWKRIMPSKRYLDLMEQLNVDDQFNMSHTELSESASKLLIGRKVLARNYDDGQYYLGTIRSQTKNNLFKIVFGPAQSKDYLSTTFQTVRLLDIIDYDHVKQHSIHPGDRVLVPDPRCTDDDQPTNRYLAGTVLDGCSIRLQKGNTVERNTGAKVSTETLTVEFTLPYNKTEITPSAPAIFIPEPFFQRISLESAMPAENRATLHQVPYYPETSLPGYPVSGSIKVPIDYTFTKLRAIKGKSLQVDYLMPPYCLPLYPVVELITRDEQLKSIHTNSDWTSGPKKKEYKARRDTLDVRIPDSPYTVKELNIKVKEQLEMFDNYKLGKSKSQNKSAVLSPQIKGSISRLAGRESSVKHLPKPPVLPGKTESFKKSSAVQGEYQKVMDIKKNFTFELSEDDAKPQISKKLKNQMMGKVSKLFVDDSEDKTNEGSNRRRTEEKDDEFKLSIRSIMKKEDPKLSNSMLNILTEQEQKKHEKKPTGEPKSSPKKGNTRLKNAFRRTDSTESESTLNESENVWENASDLNAKNNVVDREVKQVDPFKIHKRKIEKRDSASKEEKNISNISDLDTNDKEEEEEEEEQQSEALKMSRRLTVKHDSDSIVEQNISNISDLGTRDKEKEELEALKMNRRRKQAEKRLENDIMKYCSDEIKKEKRLDHKRQAAKKRISWENERREIEDKNIEKIQLRKLSVMEEIERSTEPAPSIRVTDKYDDDRDSRRIARMRQQRQERELTLLTRDEYARKYLERLEETKMKRNKQRYQNLHDRMLKEYSERNN